jgi:hypothetical protein
MSNCEEEYEACLAECPLRTRLTELPLDVSVDHESPRRELGDPLRLWPQVEVSDGQGCLIQIWSATTSDTAGESSSAAADRLWLRRSRMFIEQMHHALKLRRSEMSEVSLLRSLGKLG